MKNANGEYVNGGVVHRATIGIVTSEQHTDPEVIAPITKLKQLLEGHNQEIIDEFGPFEYEEGVIERE